MSDVKKVIFLDIDGVLNNDSFSVYQWEEDHPGKIYDPYHCFNEENVEQFNRIIEETGAKVVASTTWRLGPTLKYKMTPAWLQEIIRKNGGAKCEIIGFTPHLIPKNLYDFQVPRSQEIDAYIKESDWKDVTFVVIDDRKDAWDGFNFIRTNPRFGLTKEDADRAINILNGNYTVEP